MYSTRAGELECVKSAQATAMRTWSLCSNMSSVLTHTDTQTQTHTHTHTHTHTVQLTVNLL